MEWTFDQFFADGGTTKFVDRLAASLGIHASTIKVVQVYEGSVIIDYEIIEEAGDLDEISSDLKGKIQNEELDLGAPIISGTVGELMIEPVYWKLEEEEESEEVEYSNAIVVKPATEKHVTEDGFIKR